MSVTKGLSDFKNYLKHASLESKPHQEAAVKWTLEREHDPAPPGGIRGGLLADEMGLGKTIVMMGLIVSNFVKRTIIVLPVALVEQWKCAIKKTMGHTPLVFHGAAKKSISQEQLLNAPIVLTTYGHVSMKSKNGVGNVLHEIHWNRVIFDEAHHLRNSNTQNHAGAMKLNADARWLMTGTPIQNRISDFYSLCAVMGMPTEFYANEDNLTMIGETFMMKRTKEEAGVKLPKLEIHEEIVDWSNPKEQQLAEDIHSMLGFKEVNEKKIDNIIGNLNNGKLALFIKARQCCVYPKLIHQQVKNMQKQGVLDYNDHSLLHATNYSSKLDAVEQKVLERRYNNRSKIIFCHYRGEIDELFVRFEKKGLGVVFLDGRTSKTERDNILNSSPDVMILQIQTGCEGLNLQQFSEIYFVSPHWNPAVEDQAIARAHRLGQKQQVDVFRFIMERFDSDNANSDEITLDAYCRNVQSAKRRAMTFTEGEIGDKSEIENEELESVDMYDKTKEGYIKDGFTVD